MGSLCYVVLIEMDMDLDLIHSTICLHVSNLKWKHYPLKLKEGSLPRQRKNAGMSRASTCFERKVRKNGETLGLESHENQRTVREGFGESSLIICSGNNADNFLVCFLLLLVLFLGYHIPSFSYKMNSY